MSKIKVVAVDMDGTFLDYNNKYDKNRFNKILSNLYDKDIKFIVASGNQYAQLKSFFPNFDNKIYYISENGALINFNNQKLMSNSFNKNIAYDIAYYLEKKLGLEFLVCAEDSAYIDSKIPKEVRDFISTYYYELKVYNNIEDIPFDRVLKYALAATEGSTESVVNSIRKKFYGKAEVTTSGHESIDITAIGTNKVNALKFLLDKWELCSENLMAFGDSDNDIGMLQLANYSFAMENANDNIKSIAKYRAKSNVESGVLEVLEQYFCEK